MAKSQTLTTNIVINAKTGNGFSEVGSTLEHLGEIVSGVSTPLLQFGQESVKVYRDYQTAMLDAEVALATTYGKGSVELKKVMSDLDVAASEWARTTVFHTNDVAEAIANAAHAGWDYEQIMTGIPAAIDLARAGGMDLSSAVDYVVKSTNAAGIEFQDMSDWMNEWVFAANSSASTVEEFGEAMTAMGSTMRFAANPEELMTLIAVTADAGVTGSQAGTMIRSALMRLVSPTDKATEAMEALGASTEELDEIAVDSGKINEAMEILTDNGFTGLYDAQGKMKPVLQTFEELREALAKAAGGYENLTDNNEAAMKVLGAIFPTRTITEALNLINAAENNWGGLYDRLMAGEAEGYTQFASELMGSGLDGAIRTAESKIENLKKSVGEELEPIVTDVAGMIGDLADNLAGMDPTAFSAIVSGLEVIAVAGPGLMLAGGAMKLIGAAAATFSGAGGFILAATAIATLAAAYKDWDTSMYHAQFGDMSLDSNAVAQYLDSITQKFTDSYSEINSFNQEVQNALTNYEALTSELSSSITTKMLTNQKLSGADIAQLQQLGTDIMKEVQTGIENNYAATLASLAMSMGEDNPDFQTLSGVLTQAYEQDIATAEDLSQRLRDAMTAAFKDGHLTDDEVEAILAPIREANELMARQAAKDNYIEQQKLLRRAQTLGLDSMRESFAEARTSRDALIESRLAQMNGDYFEAQEAYQRKMDAATSDEERTRIERTWGRISAGLRADQDREVAAIGSDFNKFIATLGTTGLTSSEDLSDTWSTISALSGDFAANGMSTDLYNKFIEGTSITDTDYIQRFLGEMIDELGGFGEIADSIKYFDEIGDTSGSGLLRGIVNAANLIDAANNYVDQNANVDYNTRERGAVEGGDYEWLSTHAANYGQTLESLYNLASAGTSDMDWLQTLGFEGVGAFATQAGTTDINGWLTRTIGEGGIDVPVNPVMEETPQMEPVDMPVNAVMEEVEPEGEASGYTVSVQGDTTVLEGDLSAIDSTEITALVNGNTDGLSATIRAEDGQVLTEYVNGDPSGLASVINSYNGRTITVHIRGIKEFAAGGRATEPSIFGEGRLPEWAIPEEHSEHTASLLDAARAASGFTWPEIFARFGGLNGNPENVTTSIVYAPTINAADATGVAQVLAEDKDRFERWFRDHQMREAMEVYA